eukprot:240693-Rhodomonas_salina.1
MGFSTGSNSDAPIAALLQNHLLNNWNTLSPMAIHTEHCYPGNGGMFPNATAKRRVNVWGAALVTNCTRSAEEKCTAAASTGFEASQNRNVAPSRPQWAAVLNPHHLLL